MWDLLWLGWVIAGLMIEGFALASRTPGATLSEHVWAVTTNYPLLPLGFGILCGHFFWQRHL